VPDYRDGRDKPGHDQSGLPRVLPLLPIIPVIACRSLAKESDTSGGTTRKMSIRITPERTFGHPFGCVVAAVAFDTKKLDRHSGRAFFVPAISAVAVTLP